MRSSCSKTSPNAAYNTPGEVCEQADVNADIEDIDASKCVNIEHPFDKRDLQKLFQCPIL